MAQANDIPDDILQFIARRIDSVPHLESLLLLWENPAKLWTVEDVAGRIYVSRDRTKSILQELARHGLIMEVAQPGHEFKYDPSWDEAQLMSKVSAVYRRHLVYVASLIHTKSSSESVKEFARAFQFTKKD